MPHLEWEVSHLRVQSATVGELKIDRSFRRCSSFDIGASDLVPVALDSLGPQLSVCEISQFQTKYYHFRTIYKTLHTEASSQFSWCVPELKMIRFRPFQLLYCWCCRLGSGGIGFLRSSAFSILNFIVRDRKLPFSYYLQYIRLHSVVLSQFSWCVPLNYQGQLKGIVSRD